MQVVEPDFHVVANPDGTHAVTDDQGQVHIVCPSNADAWRWIGRHYRIRELGLASLCDTVVPQRFHRGAGMLCGSCLCGGIKYRIDGRLSGAMNCHCSICRKAQGCAFRSRAAVKSAEFEFVQGEELITFYESSPGNHRGFCRVCGSPILSKFDDHPKYYGLPLGTLDDDPGIQPKLHVHVASKAPWYTLADDLPRLPGAPQ